MNRARPGESAEKLWAADSAPLTPLTQLVCNCALKSTNATHTIDCNFKTKKIAIKRGVQNL